MKQPGDGGKIHLRNGYDVHPNGHTRSTCRHAYLNAERRIIDDEIWICDEEAAAMGVTQMIAQVRCSNAKCVNIRP